MGFRAMGAFFSIKGEGKLQKHYWRAAIDITVEDLMRRYQSHFCAVQPVSLAQLTLTQRLETKEIVHLTAPVAH